MVKGKMESNQRVLFRVGAAFLGVPLSSTLSSTLPLTGAKITASKRALSSCHLLKPCHSFVRPGGVALTCYLRQRLVSPTRLHVHGHSPGFHLGFHRRVGGAGNIPERRSQPASLPGRVSTAAPFPVSVRWTGLVSAAGTRARLHSAYPQGAILWQDGTAHCHKLPATWSVR